MNYESPMVVYIVCNPSQIYKGAQSPFFYHRTSSCRFHFGKGCLNSFHGIKIVSIAFLSEFLSTIFLFILSVTLFSLQFILSVTFYLISISHILFPKFLGKFWFFFFIAALFHIILCVCFNGCTSFYFLFKHCNYICL